ncbi:hypothetical protein HK097_000864 [Rhizophlyctis rosea]|uniref:Uncharacterized protein n=1 Tax=Rhizophlyctis rosea TaxID=64517 RepID=A0AAD5SHA0_9FUNG|nr:hypothetical protein HK097_000864 [Rhizophlyctis rosea]
MESDYTRSSSSANFPSKKIRSKVDSLHEEGQTLIESFMLEIYPTATAIRPRRCYHTQVRIFLLALTSLRTSLGVQKYRNHAVETCLFEIGYMIGDLTFSESHRSEETKTGLIMRFRQAVLGLLQAESREVQERLASLGVVQQQRQQKRARQGSGVGVIQTNTGSPPQNGPLPQAPDLSSTKSVGASGSFAEMTRPTSSSVPSISLPPPKTKIFEPSKSTTFEESIEIAPSAISPHAAALEEKIRQLDQLSRRAPSHTSPPPLPPDPSPAQQAEEEPQLEEAQTVQEQPKEEEPPQPTEEQPAESEEKQGDEAARKGQAALHKHLDRRELKEAGRRAVHKEEPVQQQQEEQSAQQQEEEPVQQEEEPNPRTLLQTKSRRVNITTNASQIMHKAIDGAQEELQAEFARQQEDEEFQPDAYWEGFEQQEEPEAEPRNRHAEISLPSAFALPPIHPTAGPPLSAQPSLLFGPTPGAIPTPIVSSVPVQFSRPAEPPSAFNARPKPEYATPQNGSHSLGLAPPLGEGQNGVALAAESETYFQICEARSQNFIEDKGSRYENESVEFAHAGQETGEGAMSRVGARGLAWEPSAAEMGKAFTEQYAGDFEDQERSVPAAERQQGQEEERAVPAEDEEEERAPSAELQLQEAEAQDQAQPSEEHHYTFSDFEGSTQRLQNRDLSRVATQQNEDQQPEEPDQTLNFKCNSLQYHHGNLTRLRLSACALYLASHRNLPLEELESEVEASLSVLGKLPPLTKEDESEIRYMYKTCIIPRVPLHRRSHTAPAKAMEHLGYCSDGSLHSSGGRNQISLATLLVQGREVLFKIDGKYYFIVVQGGIKHGDAVLENWKVEGIVRQAITLSAIKDPTKPEKENDDFRKVSFRGHVKTAVPFEYQGSYIILRDGGCQRMEEFWNTDTDFQRILERMVPSDKLEEFHTVFTSSRETLCDDDWVDAVSDYISLYETRKSLGQFEKFKYLTEQALLSVIVNNVAEGVGALLMRVAGLQRLYHSELAKNDDDDATWEAGSAFTQDEGNVVAGYSGCAAPGRRGKGEKKRDAMKDKVSSNAGGSGSGVNKPRSEGSHGAFVTKEEDQWEKVGEKGKKAGEGEEEKVKSGFSLAGGGDAEGSEETCAAIAPTPEPVTKPGPGDFPLTATGVIDAEAYFSEMDLDAENGEILRTAFKFAQEFATCHDMGLEYGKANAHAVVSLIDSIGGEEATHVCDLEMQHAKLVEISNKLAIAISLMNSHIDALTVDDTGVTRVGKKPICILPNHLPNIWNVTEETFEMINKQMAPTVYLLYMLEDDRKAVGGILEDLVEENEGKFMVGYVHVGEARSVVDHMGGGFGPVPTLALFAPSLGYLDIGYYGPVEEFTLTDRQHLTCLLDAFLYDVEWVKNSGGDGAAGGGVAGGVARGGSDAEGAEEGEIDGGAVVESDCATYWATGVCKNGSACRQRHDKPIFSKTVLLKHFYMNPQHNPNCTMTEPQLQEHFDLFYEDLFVELGKYGEIEALVVCDNVGDHLVGNVYIQYTDEREAAGAVKALKKRYYEGRLLNAEVSRLPDFAEACCRQYEFGSCVNGPSCDYLHAKMISSSLGDRLLSILDGRSRWKTCSLSRLPLSKNDFAEKAVEAAVRAASKSSSKVVEVAAQVVQKVANVTGLAQDDGKQGCMSKLSEEAASKASLKEKAPSSKSSKLREEFEQLAGISLSNEQIDDQASLGIVVAKREEQPVKEAEPERQAEPEAEKAGYEEDFKKQEEQLGGAAANTSLSQTGAPAEGMSMSPSATPAEDKLQHAIKAPKPATGTPEPRLVMEDVTPGEDHGGIDENVEEREDAKVWETQDKTDVLEHVVTLEVGFMQPEGEAVEHPRIGEVEQTQVKKEGKKKRRGVLSRLFKNVTHKPTKLPTHAPHPPHPPGATPTSTKSPTSSQSLTRTTHTTTTTPTPPQTAGGEGKKRKKRAVGKKVKKAVGKLLQPFRGSKKTE